MLIGELVKKTGLNKSTIRYYEEMGLIQPKMRQAGTRHYREYDDTVLQRIDIIKHGKKMGFSLKEGKYIIDVLMNQTLSKKERIAMMQEKLEQIHTKIAELEHIKQMIEIKICDIQNELSN